MYKVLLADDEPMAIEGLKMFVDWQRLGFDICGVCENGEEALVKIEETSPELVVTDIRMPVLDGLELIGRVRHMDVPQPIFIVMSGFSEFEYARTALRYGVKHYLLKPALESELEHCMEDVLAELESMAKSKQRSEILSRELMPTTIAQIVRGESPSPNDSVWTSIDELDVKASGWRFILAEHAGVGTAEPIQRLIKHAAQPYGSIVVDLDDRHTGIVVEAETGFKKPTASAIAEIVYETLISRGYEILVSIGPEVNSLHEIAVSYVGAAEASVYGFFHPVEGPIDYDVVRSHEVSYDLQVESVDELLNTAERLQEKEVIDMVRNLFATFRLNRTAPDVVNMMIGRIVLKSVAVLRELGIVPDEWVRYRNLPGSGLISLEAERQSVMEYLQEYMEQLKRHKEVNSGQPLKDVERFILEHYKESLTIKKIGETFYIHPVYLGQAFYKKYGVGITEFIHDLRIAEAKRLLTESSESIRSIAEQVGYLQYHHFLKQFEKRMSMKPAKFREGDKLNF